MYQPFPIHEAATAGVAAMPAVDSGGIAPAASTAHSAVQAFLRFDQDHRALASADTTHEYTADGLRRLAVALGAINEQDAAHRGTLQPRLSALLTRANELEKNPESTRHSEYTRAAFMDAASVMGMLQQQRFPTLHTNVAQVAQVKQAAAAVQPNTLLLQQKATVQKFFDSAADAVRAMTR